MIGQVVYLRLDLTQRVLPNEYRCFVSFDTLCNECPGEFLNPLTIIIIFISTLLARCGGAISGDILDHRCASLLQSCFS